MQAACFRCRDTKQRTDLTHEEFIAVLASIGRPETQTFFVISCNLERRRRRDLMRSIAIIAFLALFIIGEAYGALMQDIKPGKVNIDLGEGYNVSFAYTINMNGISDGLDCLEDPQWWAVFVALLAVFVALLLGVAGIFQDSLKRKIWKPNLEVEFRLNPPDSHKIADHNDSTGEFMYNVYSLRARVKNTGNYQLEDVEAMAIELTKKEPNGQFKNVENFLPLNLVWAHTRGKEITKPKIQPKMFKFLDFGHISQVKDVNTRYSSISAHGNTLLVLEVEVAPYTGSHLVLPGEYRIKLVFAANNLSPINKIYSLIIADKWTEDEKEMLENYIFIKEEKSMY